MENTQCSSQWRVRNSNQANKRKRQNSSAPQGRRQIIPVVNDVVFAKCDILFPGHDAKLQPAHVEEGAVWKLCSFLNFSSMQTNQPRHAEPLYRWEVFFP